jgi:hypothetical protein
MTETVGEVQSVQTSGGQRGFLDYQYLRLLARLLDETEANDRVR